MSSRPTFSCIRCADRKVKCDRQKPCGACVKHNVDCVFQPSRPRKEQRRAKNQILVDRLKHYEALLQEHGLNPTNPTDTSDLDPHLLPPTPSSIDLEPTRCINKTQVVHRQGRSKFVDNLWTRVVEEFRDPEDALEDTSDDTSDLEASDDDFGFVLNRQPKSNTRSLHPPPERILQLWQIFIENVDPLTKIVHVPTLRPAMQKAVSDIGAIPRGFEVLMFAIYGAAVMSMNDDDCKQRLGEPRKTLLSRYISATKAALSRAKFMGTISLVVLQALVIHLLSVRDIYEPRAIWSLTGVAVRIAQSMGLDRDGTLLGLPPFEAEMRRRIWWLLKGHDFRTAELCGLAKFRDLDMSAENTKGPTNVNDDQLYPGMPSLPAESNTLTDVVFIAIRHELTNFAAGRIARFRQQGKSSSEFNLRALGSNKSEIDEAFRQVEEVLETKYLRYCDPTNPLHLVTMVVARTALNIVRFMTHHPRQWASLEQTPLSERQWIWEISIKLLEQHHMVQSSPQLKQFAWNAAYYLPWHICIHVLDTLRANPLIAEAEKAWQAVRHTYENNADMISDTKKPIHVAVGNLCLKAYGAREAALQEENIRPPPTPEFISQLRQQREVAKAKRQARIAKGSQSETPANDGQANARHVSPTLQGGDMYPNDNLGSRHSTMSHPSDYPPPGDAPEGDSFWFLNGFEDGQVGDPNNVMDMDLDTILAQNHTAEGNDTQAFNWQQWDAWLADSNVMHPLASARDL
ncbi:MAG: hypothetical protein Q9182_004495 [Xanthomendoza sp. 2 TL-2023]